MLSSRISRISESPPPIPRGTKSQGGTQAVSYRIQAQSKPKSATSTMQDLQFLHHPSFGRLGSRARVRSVPQNKRKTLRIKRQRKQDTNNSALRTFSPSVRRSEPKVCVSTESLRVCPYPISDDVVRGSPGNKTSRNKLHSLTLCCEYTAETWRRDGVGGPIYL